ncbi:Type I restriction enzyme specificity protein MPN_089 [Streptococcus anginosus]|uniref:restriction endonuclease subunit S n=3 Tax=Streptococcus TaxID=1301 RepID=UPI00086F5623|nr:restriction endonuclease subunit S [Streptococcus anginosus]MCW1027505.1 restriction endonuclease subunit S [Streptococcus anginosus]SCQ07448.1 Type I restriction enzyme specificity protein MPN_089 [Streptococcus anginosus]
MNILEEIQNCSVEWKELGEVVDYEQPTKYIVSSKAYTESNEIPVLTAGQSFILGYTNEKDGIYQASKNNPVIIFDDFTTSKQWVDFKFKVKSSAMKMLTIKDEFKSEVLLRYVWHYLGTINYKPDQHGRQWIGTYSKFLIPILPLEIQEKIVQILDKFTEYVTELTSELTSELTLRQKQYSYFRDYLLNFDEDGSGGANNKVYQVERKMLNEFLKKGKGTKITASQMKLLHKEGAPIRIFAGGKTYADVNYGDIPDKDIHTEEAIVVKSRGIIDFEYCTEPFSFKNEFWSYSSDNENINLRYIYHYLVHNKEHFQNIANNMQMPQISSNDTEKFKIPVPSLEIQSRIVQVLDNFDMVCHDLNIGLPKEIELRQKQYEYFRDKLLTFIAEGVYTESRVEEWDNSAIIKLLQWVFGPIRVELGAMAKIVRGASPRPISKFITESEKGVPWIKIGDVEKDSKYVSKTKERITQAGREKSRLVHKGDFIMSNSMSFGRPYILNIDGCIHDGWLSMNGFEDVCLPDYLYHYLLTDTMQYMMRKNASNGTVQNLNADIVRQLIIILPPLSIQSQIVSILDKLDTLTNSLSEGLPKEIELRQKQYEYWREQLLNFTR